MESSPRIDCPAVHSDAAQDVEDDKLDLLVAQLCRMKRDSKLILAIDVGRLVIDQVYGGSRETFRRRGKHHTGFRRLAVHPNLPFSRSTLWRYVGVCDLVSRMPGLVRCDALTVAHLTAVLRLEPEVQERLLKVAVKEGWSAAHLEREARNASEPHRAPKQKSSVLMAIRRLERLHADVLKLGRVGDLADNERDRIRRVIEDTKSWCEAVDSWLTAGSVEN